MEHEASEARASAWRAGKPELAQAQPSHNQSQQQRQDTAGLPALTSHNSTSRNRGDDMVC